MTSNKEEIRILIQNAVNYHQSGRFKDAEDLYRRILHLEPANKDANRLLGIISAQAGNYSMAETFISKAIETDPHDPDLFRDLGLALKSKGTTTEAITALQKAIHLNPKDTKAYTLLGDVFMEQGHFEQAVTAYGNAIRIDPGDAHLFNKLGNAHSALGQYHEAETAFINSLNLLPGLVEARYNLANAFRDQDKLEDAEDAYLQALELRPNLAIAHHNLGIVYQKQGRFMEAIRSFEESLNHQPDLAQAHYNIGSTYRDIGKLDLSRAALKKAIQIQPDLAEAHHLLVKLQNDPERDEHTSVIENLLADPGLNDRQRIYLHFALGKIFEDSDRFDSAFSHIQKANRINRATYDYEVTRDLNFFSEVKDIFNTRLVNELSGTGAIDQIPIFVLGMPRSGTSLVEQILASHPLVHGAGELETFSQIILEYCRNSEGHFPAQVPRLEREEFDLLGMRYIESLRHLSSKRRIVDKMPHNFMYVGMIRLTLPNAKIIHCRRNSMDTCWSIFKTLFTAHHGYAYDLNELGDYYRGYQDLMDHWRMTIPDKILDVEYENLVENQEKETARLLEYCGLEWDDACLYFHKTERPVSTASAVQVRKPIYTSSISKWQWYKRHLTDLRSVLYPRGIHTP